MTKQKSKLTYFGKIVFEFDYKNYSKVKKCVFEGGWKTYKMSFRWNLQVMDLVEDYL